LPPWSSQSIASHLDDPKLIDTHLPDLKALKVITSAPGNIKIAYEPRNIPLTLRHLLTHTSGVGYDMVDPRLRAWRKSRGEKTMTLHGPLPESVSTPLLFQPGMGWAYGGGLDWVGVFIERASGQKFGAWLRERLFDVLGCDAGIGFARQEVEKAGEVVQVVTKGNDGRLKEQKVKDQEAGVERGGGGLYASASNMQKLLADIISPVPKLLAPEVADLLFAPQLLPDSKALEALQISASSFRSMSGPLTPSNDVSGINHALGGMIVTQDNADLGNTKGTMTWGGAFNCMWFANRTLGVSGFYASSMFPPGEGRSSELMGELLKEVWENVS
jgi:CubicO group peptidase (beta-lactamase class C family)